ncbi:RNA polymerase sigma-70 factor (sigma-E family) [Marmoricola sp. URHA0025 HA25]
MRRQVFGSNRDEERDQPFVEYVAGRRARLYRTAYLICGDAHRADDLVQIALAKAYVAWPRLQRAGNVDAYVRRILVNAHVDETRRGWRRERPGLPEIDASAPAHEGHEELWEALRTLAAGQRRIVVLRHYWGLSVEETAADLGISQGTVKSQTSAALAHLRHALTEAGTGAHHDRAR